MRTNVQCAQDSQCNLASGGRCTTAPNENMWCSYPDGACPSGYRWSSDYTGEGLSGKCVEQVNDAGVDAGIDAPRTPAFDVIYGDNWRIAVDAPNDGWFLVAANGVIDPDLSTLKIKAVSDTHPTATVRVNSAPITGVIAHGRVGGKIFVDNQALYSTAFTEPREYSDVSLLTLQLIDAPAGEYTFDAHVELSINAVDFALEFGIRHVDSEITYVMPEAVKRLTIYR